MKGGFLFKRPKSNRLGSWQKRWFVLHEKMLTYYSNDKDDTPLGILKLDNAKLKIGDSTLSKDRTELARIFALQVGGKELVLRADSEAIMRGWVKAFEESGVYVADIDTGVVTVSNGNTDGGGRIISVKAHLPEGGFVTVPIVASSTVKDLKTKIAKKQFKDWEAQVDNIDLIFSGGSLDDGKKFEDLDLPKPNQMELQLEKKKLPDFYFSSSRSEDRSSIGSNESDYVPLVAGFLMRGKKLTAKGKYKWRKRWVVLLNNGMLEVYKNAEDESPDLTVNVPVSTLEIPGVAEVDKEHVFRISHPALIDSIFAAENANDFKGWLAAINVVLPQSSGKGLVLSPKMKVNNTVMLLLQGNLFMSIPKKKAGVQWRRRWFSLFSDGTFNRFRRENDIHAVASIQVSKSTVTKYGWGKQMYGIKLQGSKHRIWKMLAETKDSQDGWIQAFLSAGCSLSAANHYSDEGENDTFDANENSEDDDESSAASSATSRKVASSSAAAAAAQQQQQQKSSFSLFSMFSSPSTSTATSATTVVALPPPQQQQAAAIASTSSASVVSASKASSKKSEYPLQEIVPPKKRVGPKRSWFEKYFVCLCCVSED